MANVALLYVWDYDLLVNIRKAFKVEDDSPEPFATLICYPEGQMQHASLPHES